LNGQSDIREYKEDIDRVFHEAGVSLTPDQVNGKINKFRNSPVCFQDTVSPGAIALEAPCDF
jgi:hypothetical protein